MNCREAQESILESLIGPLPAEAGLSLDAHLAGCQTCAGFAASQRRLDARLAAALPPPQLSPAFRAGLKKRMRRDPLTVWPDYLPDVANLIGCTVAIGLSLVLLPVPATTVLAAGAVFAAANYLFQAALRTALEE